MIGRPMRCGRPGPAMVLLVVAVLVGSCAKPDTPPPVTAGVATLAGTAGSSGAADGTGAAARFEAPLGVAVDGSGNVYVADSNNYLIRKITSAGAVTTLAGTAGLSGSTDATGTSASFGLPDGIAVDGSGNVYVADTSGAAIRKVTPAGAVTTVAAGLDHPGGLAVDGSGNLYVGNLGDSTIRKVTSGGSVSILAGTAGVEGSADGTGAAASFGVPAGVAVDGSGNVFVADQLSHTIRKITAAGVVTTIAGTAGVSGAADGAGTAASFNAPAGVAVDGSGNVFVADAHNHTIRRITPAGVVTTVAGTAGVSGSTDGSSPTSFDNPSGIAVDGSGKLYVADSANNTIRTIT